MKRLQFSMKQLLWATAAACGYIALSMGIINDLHSIPGIVWVQVRLLALLLILGLILCFSGGEANKYFIVGAVLGGILVLPLALYALGVHAPLLALNAEVFCSALGALLIGSIGLIVRRNHVGWGALLIGIGFTIYEFFLAS